MKRPTGKTIVWAALTVLFVGGWLVALRPELLGGPAGYVMVRGTSMLPTYKTGDLIITKKASTYAKGDIVAYRVPAGDAGEGIVIIHRIVDGSASAGFVAQGDNNPYRDDWLPKPTDMIGKAWVRIPKIGIVLAFLHSPLPLASLAAGIAVAFVLFPSDKKRKRARAGDAISQPDIRLVGDVPDAEIYRPSILAVLPTTATSNGTVHALDVRDDWFVPVRDAS